MTNDDAGSAKEFVRRLFDRWAAGDRSGLDRVIASGARWSLMGSCRGGGSFDSTAAFMALSSRPFHALLERVGRPEIQEVIGDGDVVIVRWRGEAVTRRGRPYVNQYCWVLRLEEERIVEVLSYCDTHAIARVWEAATEQGPTR